MRGICDEPRRVNGLLNYCIRPQQALYSSPSQLASDPGAKGGRGTNVTTLSALSTSSTKMPPHHSASFANGYPRGNTFDLAPHRYVIDNLAERDRWHGLTILLTDSNLGRLPLRCAAAGAF